MQTRACVSEISWIWYWTFGFEVSFLAECCNCTTIVMICCLSSVCNRKSLYCGGKNSRKKCFQSGVKKRSDWWREWSWWQKLTVWTLLLFFIRPTPLSILSSCFLHIYSFICTVIKMASHTRQQLGHISSTNRCPISYRRFLRFENSTSQNVRYSGAERWGNVTEALADRPG